MLSLPLSCAKGWSCNQGGRGGRQQGRASELGGTMVLLNGRPAPATVQTAVCPASRMTAHLVRLAWSAAAAARQARPAAANTDKSEAQTNARPQSASGHTVACLGVPPQLHGSFLSLEIHHAHIPVSTKTGRHGGIALVRKQQAGLLRLQESAALAPQIPGRGARAKQVC